jgi:hypothetical protein
MDLANYGRVFWRFRFLMLGGLVLAIVLAAFSMAKITSHGLAYRKPEIFASQSTLLLTQQGFPWGRTMSGPNEGYPGFASLTDLYAQFANSDAVLHLMERDGAPKSWKISAAPVIPSDGSGTLPVIDLTGSAYSPQDAVRATELGRAAFLAYVRGQQQAGGIPTSQRIELQTIQAATKPLLIQGRKKTLPIIVFLAVLCATVALAFVLENIRPRRSVLASADAPSLGRSAPAYQTRKAASGTSHSI